MVNLREKILEDLKKRRKQKNSKPEGDETMENLENESSGEGGTELQEDAKTIRLPKWIWNLLRKIKIEKGFKTYAEALNFLMTQMGINPQTGEQMIFSQQQPTATTPQQTYYDAMQQYMQMLQQQYNPFIPAMQASAIGKVKTTSGMTSSDMKDIAEAKMWALTNIYGDKMMAEAFKSLAGSSSDKDKSSQPQPPYSYPPYPYYPYPHPAFYNPYLQLPHPSQPQQQTGSGSGEFDINKAMMWQIIQQPTQQLLLLLLARGVGSEGEGKNKTDKIVEMIMENQRQMTNLIMQLQGQKFQSDLVAQQQAQTEEFKEFIKNISEAYNKALEKIGTKEPQTPAEALKVFAEGMKAVNEYVTAVREEAKKLKIPEEQTKTAIESGEAGLKVKILDTIGKHIGAGIEKVIKEKGGQLVDAVTGAMIGERPPPPSGTETQQPTVEQPQTLTEITEATVSTPPTTTPKIETTVEKTETTTP